MTHKKRYLSLPSFVLQWKRKKQWYHQRFDGAPLYLFAVGEAETQVERRKPSGTEARDSRVSFFSADGKGDWYLGMDDIHRGSQAIIRLARQNRNISRQLMHKWLRDEQNFKHFFWSFQAQSLKQLTDTELMALYKKYYRLFHRRFTSSSIIDHFALGTDDLIATMLRKELGKLGKESDFTSAFSIATAPTKQSFVNEAEIELLKIALKPQWTRFELEDYQSKYFWTRNNYFSAKVLTVKHFEREIRLWKESGVDLRGKCEQLKNTPGQNARRKAKLFRRYRLSPLLRTLLKISDDFTWWQDERKKSTYFNIHLGTIILGEMARRIKVGVELTKWLMPAEVESFFLRGKPDATELKKRAQGCAFIVWGSGYYVVPKMQLESLRRLMFGKQQHDEIKDLRGLTASVGRAIGTVRIINSAREVHKVKKGDILVAVMTRPDYMAGLKNAAAIVTNEGGITCHAAIVSREMGIPCIINTKIATEVLKDGDLVEVNANHGVVTILKRV